MVADEKSCEDVLTQVMAAKSALNQVGLHVIAHTVKTCATAPDDPADRVIDQSLGLFLTYARSTPEDRDNHLAAPAGAERAVTEELLGRLAERVAHTEHMVEREDPCGDVLDAVLDAKRLLDEVGLQVVAHAMRTCMAPDPGADRDQVVDEAMAVFIRYIGCVR